MSKFDNLIYKSKFLLYLLNFIKYLLYKINKIGFFYYIKLKLIIII